MGVSIRKKDGNFYIFIRHAGKRVAHKCVDEAHAIDMQKAVSIAISAGNYDIAALKKKSDEKPELPTVETYYDKTFSPVYVESAVADSTAANYEKNFRLHINPVFGSMRLDEVSHDAMERFVSDLVKKKLAKATIETIIKNFRALFNHARKRKLIVDNPASGLTQLYSQAKPKHETIEPLTKKEVPLFLKSVRDHAPQHYALFVTAIHTGVRLGELAGLQKGDIDFAGKYLIIQRSIDRIHRKILPTKTKRIRRIDLSDELINVLKEHLRQQKESWLKREVPEGQEPKPEPEWLFPNREGSWPDIANIAERHFHRCMENAGLHRRRPYDLRHTFASLMLTNGAPIQYVSEQMGHRNIQLTVKLYGHLQPGANRHWMNRLPGLQKRRVATSGNWKQKTKKAAEAALQMVDFKAGHGIRTRDFDLGKVALYH